ncbi:MAG: ABC transporter permease [Clostridiaceae bacterium]|nr:ABC transporter permease [Clostridiaceae bacterium]
MRIWTWFCLSCKRQLKHPGYLILLLFLPLVLYGAAKMEAKDEEGVKIALYVEGGDLAERTVASLMERDSVFDFYRCDTVEELEREVSSKQAECGYIFYEDLEERLNEEKYRRSIGLCTSPATVISPLASEVVFAALMEQYGRVLLENYVINEQGFEPLDEKQAWAELSELFDMYRTNHSTFAFAYDTIDGGNIQDVTVKTGFPVRGVAAVMVFIAGIFASVMLLEDEKKGLYIPVPYSQKLWCKAASVLALVFLAAVSGLVSLKVTGNMGNFGYELACMAVYVILVSGFAFLLKSVVRNGAVICCLIPFFIIGSLILCPVFLDVGQWLPDIKIAQRLFLPYYYLKMF